MGRIWTSSINGSVDWSKKERKKINGKLITIAATKKNYQYMQTMVSREADQLPYLH